MSAETAIYSVLSTITDCEFFPVQYPDPDTLPAAFGIYAKMGGESFSGLGGDSNVSRPRMQVSIYATSYGQVKSIEYAVKAAMKAANIAGTLVNVSASVPVDGFENETRYFYCHCDFYVWAIE